MNKDILSPLDTAYNRLDEVHRAWHIGLDGYHKIDDFRAAINTAIQALRNLTFVLQKQKGKLENFDSWYAGWEKKMKDDPILKQLHQARNFIIKEEDLKLHSFAKARIKGWVDFEKMVFAFDPSEDSHAVAMAFYDNYAKHFPMVDEMRKRVIFEFERKWFYEKLPDHELLEVIAHAYNFFYAMLKDASYSFSLLQKKNYCTGIYCSSDFNDRERLKCMVVTLQERSLIFGFNDGAVLKMQTQTVFRDRVDLKKAEKRYGNEWKSPETLSLLEGIFPEEYPFDQMKLFAQAAISNLKKDKHLIPASFIFLEKGTVPIVILIPFTNQGQKIISIDKIATEILKNNAKSVLVIAEAWQYKLDENNQFLLSEYNKKDAEELLIFHCLSPESIKNISIPFKRDIFGRIVFLKPRIENFSPDNKEYLGILTPMINALKTAKNK